MRFLFSILLLAFAITALPSHDKRGDDDDDDDDDVDQSRHIVRSSSKLFLKPGTTARASAVIDCPLPKKSQPTAQVIAVVQDPVPLQFPDGIYQCGRLGDGIARYYRNTHYTCFNGKILCPILTNNRRTRPCGDCCFDPDGFSCSDHDRILDIPCSRNKDCDQKLEYADLDDISINKRAVDC